MSESLSFQRFESRHEHLLQHSQVVAVALNKLFNKLQPHKRSGHNLCGKLKISPSMYSKLNIPCTEYARIINYSKRENGDYCVIDLYNLFSYYMKDILKEMYLLRPKSITEKSNKEVKFSKLSEFTSIDDVVDFMIDEIFRDLENLRSTQKLVKRIIAHTKIQIPQLLSNEAMMYLNMRHLIVHNNSKIDKEYFDNYHNKLPISVGGKVPTDYSTRKNAHTAVFNYLKHIDTELIRMQFINSRY